MTEVEYAELHTPLFLNGTNLGQKLDAHKRHGLTLFYDEDKRWLTVTYGNNSGSKTAVIPEANVASFVAGGVKKPDVKVVAPAKPVTAQVSTPMDHVFQGAGGGKTK